MKKPVASILRTALSAVSQGVCIVDGEGIIVFVNKPLCTMYGYSEPELLGRTWPSLWADETEAAAILEELGSGAARQWEGDFLHRDREGGTVEVSLTITPAAEDGDGTFFIAVSVERQGRDRLETALDRLSRQDGLTSLPDQSHFHEILEKEWRRGQRQSLPLAVVIIDIDHFRAYNEEYGSRAGNEVLRTIAAEIATQMKRSGDLAVRLAGAQFGVLLPGVDLEHAARFAESFRAGIERLRIAHSASPHGGVVTVSLGAASAVPARGASPDILLDAAGKALRDAKGGGRNRVGVADTRG